jgi:hypothetical protein
MFAKASFVMGVFVVTGFVVISSCGFCTEILYGNSVRKFPYGVHPQRVRFAIASHDIASHANKT